MDTSQGRILVFDSGNSNIPDMITSLQSSFQVSIAATNVSHICQSTWNPAPDLVIFEDSEPSWKMAAKLEQIKGNVGTCHLPVVVITKTMVTRDRTRYFSAGCIDCIPFETPEEEFIVRIGSHVKTGQYANLLRRTSRDSQEEIQNLSDTLQETAQKKNEEDSPPEQPAFPWTHQQRQWSPETLLIHQQKIQSIGVLTFGVAHEINNPLNGIINYSQLINDRIDPSELKIKKFVTAIIREGNRVSTLVRDLLLYARPEEEDLAEENILEIVQNTLRLIQATIRRDSISLVLDIPDNLPKVPCRSREIQQVLLNLIMNSKNALNARYRNHDENKILRLRSHLMCDESRQWIRTTLEDNGLVIGRDSRETISNFGMPASRSILDRHRGRLIVENIPRGVTHIHMDLPLC